MNVEYIDNLLNLYHRLLSLPKFVKEAEIVYSLINHEICSCIESVRKVYELKEEMSFEKSFKKSKSTGDGDTKEDIIGWRSMWCGYNRMSFEKSIEKISKANKPSCTCPHCK